MGKVIAKEVYDFNDAAEVQVKHEDLQSGERIYVQTRAKGNATNYTFRVTDNEHKICTYIPRDGLPKPDDVAIWGVHQLGFEIKNIDRKVHVDMIGSGKLGVFYDRKDPQEDFSVTVPDTPKDLAISLDAADSVLEYWRRYSPLKDDPLANKMVEMAQAYIATTQNIYSAPFWRERLDEGDFPKMAELGSDATVSQAIKTAHALNEAGLETTSNLDMAHRRQSVAETMGFGEAYEEFKEERK